MSLRVWLPLNGDLRLLGISNAVATNDGATIDNNGKIGKCYNFNNTHIIVDSTDLQDILSSTTLPFSMACWIYLNSDETDRVIIFGNYSANPFVNWELLGNCTQRLCAGGTSNFTNRANSTVVPKTIWTHIAVTYDGATTTFYQNGVSAGSVAGANTLTTKTASSRFYLGSDVRNDATRLKGKMNDFRFYDHCLSTAEVKEIALGLVLHYKLDDPYVEATTNLYNGTFSNTCYNGATGKYSYGTTTDIYKTTGTFQGKESVKIYMGTAGLNAYPYVYFDAFNTAGTAVHTLSFDYYPTSLTSIIPYSYNDSYNISYITSNGAHDSKTNVSSIIIPVITNQWNHISITMQKYDTTNTSRGNGYIRIGSASHTSTTTDYWLFANIQIEAKDHETGYTAPGTTRSNVQILDSSGYNHNGTIVGLPKFSKLSLRYNYSTSFDGISDCIIVPYNLVCPENIFTINLWFKKDEWGTKGYETLFGGPSGFEMDTRSGTNQSLLLNMVSTRSGKRNLVTEMSLGEWYMITMTRDGVTEKYYVNGIFLSEIEAKAMPTGTYRIGAWASNTGQNYYGYINDFRIYATPLLDTDIKLLYNVSMKIDKLGSAHSFEFIELQSNIIFPIELSRSNLEFTNGLSRYTQANCQVTLTDLGYRIYRPPNLTTANDGNTMFGGLKLVNQSSDTVSPYDATRDNIWLLLKGHTYIIAFHAKGLSSNSTNYMSFNNNMGWGVGGVSPNPTVITSSAIPTNFNGEKECYYIFTITDEIIKTSNDARANYDGSSNYLSYRHFTFGWAYSNTGTLGTDLYLTNFRLYDITTAMAKITKQGQAKFDDFVEQLSKTQIRRNSELLSSQFIER